MKSHYPKVDLLWKMSELCVYSFVYCKNNKLKVKDRLPIHYLLLSAFVNIHDFKSLLRFESKAWYILPTSSTC